jgi:peptidyl-prolyl cis-trans isomerase B (cyclophilin B)
MGLGFYLFEGGTVGLFGERLYTPKYKVVGDEIAVFDTSRGTIRVALDGEGAPIHVANFCELATSGFYDQTKFHRYVPGFVIQGGDPNTRDMTAEAVAAGRPGPKGRPGTGGPGYRIREEFSTNPRNSHVDGALAMARSQDPNSAGSQFYFCLGAQHGLDSGYTVFGNTIDGAEVIGALRAGDIIEHVTIEHETR